METLSPVVGNDHGLVVKIQRFSLQDGPGIRTTVFLKGCPLRCLWCSNPETQTHAVELEYDPGRCPSQCNRCLMVCTHDFLTKKDGVMKIDREKCTGCGMCVQACEQRALALIGKRMRVEEVVKEIEKDRPFYNKSGGGVTVSGGEPLYQPKFTGRILQACKEQGIATALDTTGLIEWETFRSLLQYADTVLYDIKHVDAAEHRRGTGVDNRAILDNARRVSEQGIPLVLRMPVIPGYNDDPQTLRRFAEFALRLPNAGKVDLLPYHRLGAYKYQRLGRKYLLENLQPATRVYMQKVKETLSSMGLHSSIVS